MRPMQHSGLSPFTPPPRAAAPGLHAQHAPQAQGMALTAALRPGAPGLPIAGRPAPLPASARALRAAASMRFAAADVSQRLNRSMRAAAEKATEVSAATWCWFKIKTQWQFWLALAFLMAGWFLFAQHPAAEALQQAHEAYDLKYQESAQLQADVNQLRQVYEPLRRGDPYAWEKLARRQLGWKQKSEVITVKIAP